MHLVQSTHKNKIQVTRYTFDRTRAQAVGCRIPTAAARVQYQVRSCGDCGQSGTEVGFLSLNFIPPPAPYSLIILLTTVCSYDADHSGCRV
jgi:hypothetical protein